MTLRYPALAAAVAAFDAAGPERDRLWSSINAPADVLTAEAQDLADITALREAFYQETKEYNSHADCMRLNHLDIRRTAELEI